MVCDMGIQHQVKQISRVVAFIKEEVSYDIVDSCTEEDMILEIWIRLGHRGTK